MICQSCEKVAATFHLTEIVSGEKKEVHLCDACAQSQGITPFSVGSLLAELAGAAGGAIDEESGSPVDRMSCPHCGLDYDDFRSRGRLGCAHDYEAFRAALVPLLENIHGATQHVGKVPTRLGAEMVVEKELIDLRRELQKAIQHEEYERAATLRDKIRTVEKTLASGDAEESDGD